MTTTDLTTAPHRRNTMHADLIAVPAETARSAPRKRKQLNGFQFTAAFVVVAGSGFGTAFVLAQIITRAAS
jgi:hypothetical protein